MPGDGVDMIDMSGFKQNPCNYTQSDIAPRDYRGNLRLTYPVSIARNIAWVASTTHFVLTSDIELLPNPSLIQDFLALIARNDASLQAVRRKVFVPPVFVHRDGNQSMPETKLELIKMEKQGAVRPFFKDYCLRCHRIPNYKGWIKDSNPGNSFTLLHPIEILQLIEITELC